MIDRSVNDISQILKNSKEKIYNSLILDKNKDWIKIAQIGNYCQLKAACCQSIFRVFLRFQCSKFISGGKTYVRVSAPLRLKKYNFLE